MCDLANIPLSPLQRANFFLLASFGTYNNSLDSYETTDNDTCCYTQGNCSEKCGTILRYCFKEYGTVNNISDDENSALNCIEGTFRRAALSDPTEYIDYSTPPVDINSNTPTISTLTYQVADWPVSDDDTLSLSALFYTGRTTVLCTISSG